MTVGAQRQILVIEDERDILDITRQALAAEGYQVLTAANAAAGLQIFECQWREIDLVLLDYLLPDMTGDLVFECLQQINPEVRVILFTGCEDQVAKQMLTQGLRGFIQKPFLLREFLQQIRDELETG